MAITNEDIIGKILPNVYLGRIILQSGANNNLLANLQFVLKDTFGNDEISTWLENSDILKHFSLYVVQSANADVTKKLQEEYKKITTEGVSYFLQAGDAIGFTAPPGTFKASIIRPFPAGTRLQDLVQSGKAELVANSDGSDTYNIYFDLNFDSGITNDPEHLSYLFFTYYNLTSLLSGDFADFIPLEDRIALGVTELNTEYVIKNGNVLTTTNIFVDSDEKIWPGSVHYITRNSRKVIRSGQTEGPDSIDLEEIQVNNYKLQDFRLLRNLTEFIQIDESEIQSEILKGFDNINLRQELDILDDELKDSSFSDLFSSIDENLNVSLTFFIDFKRMFIKNSLFGSVLDRVNTRSSRRLIDVLYSLASIEAIKIKRKRIDLDESLLLKKSPKITVVEIDKQGLSSAEKPILLDGIRSLFPNKDTNQQLRMFSLTDSTKKEIGSYQYELELTYKDNIRNFIEETIIASLDLEKQIFTRYHQFASNPENFNESTNRIRFSASSRYPNLSKIIDFNMSGNRYLSILTSIFDVSNSNLSRYISTINSWLNPAVATPNSIENVIKLYDYLIETFRKCISLTKFINNSLNEKNEGTVNELRVAGNIQTILIEKKFCNIVNLQHSYKMEYLNFTKPTSIRFDDQPTSYEMLKVDLINKKLDPNSKINVNLTEQQQYNSIYKKLSSIFEDFTNLEIYKKRRSNFDTLNLDIPLYRSSQPFTGEITDSILYSADFNELTQQVSSSVTLTYRDDLESINHDASRLLNNFSHFNIEEKRAINKTLLAVLNPTVQFSEKEVSIVIDDSETLNFFWITQPYNTKIITTNQLIQADNMFKNGDRLNTEDILNLPNQIKSLIKFKLASETQIIGDAWARFRYELIKRVEVLDGFTYDKEKERFLLSEPVWKKFEDPNTVIGNSQFLFCRLRDYNNDKIKYRFNQSLSDLTLNEHFFINDIKIHDNGQIKNGATQISIQVFEDRCVKELQRYFNGEEEPDIKFSINNLQLNLADSYTNSKYSFLAPAGFIFDSTYFMINTYMIPFEQLNLTLNLRTGDLYKYIYVGQSVSTHKNPPEDCNYNNYALAIYSGNRN